MTPMQQQAIDCAAFTPEGRLAAPRRWEQHGTLHCLFVLTCVLDPFTGAEAAGWWWDSTKFPYDKTNNPLDPRLLKRGLRHQLGRAGMPDGLYDPETGTPLGAFSGNGSPGPLIGWHENRVTRYIPMRRDEMSDRMWAAVADRPQPFPAPETH